MLAPVIAAMVLCTASVHGAATVVSNLAAAHRAGAKLVGWFSAHV